MPHNHQHETPESLPFEEKLIKLLEHWVKHNHEHAATYRDWAEKAKGKRMPATVALLEEAADMTLLVSRKFEKALDVIKGEMKTE
ncbi:MAG: hypothetical protein JRF71_04145 [Deltaproteobacteria bacterium]|nr:hypothetical protein [Deltaproteobacteria bacterium]MBW2200012.1 hypothetical protein [Deltaproteobacteria bacterium]MBW2538736.1 hypothetical protein [Deltaproteobacteria bacterium]